MRQRRLIVASHNLHKIKEIKTLAAPLNLLVLGLPELGDYPEIEEDGDSFFANARKKAEEISKSTGELVLADDSGLEVDALGGAPGVLSARYAGEPADDERNNKLLLSKLKKVPKEQRGAQFRCVIALARPGEETQFSEGICRGEILFSPKGTGGFGYDPLFFIPTYGQTFAELGPEIKNEISHRFLAMQEMLKILAEIGE